MIRQIVTLLSLAPLLTFAAPKQLINHPYAAAEPSPSPLDEPQNTGSQGSRMVAENSILRVNSTNQAYDFFQPWLKKSPVSRRGVGVLVQGGCVLVTAELVMNSNFVELEKATTAEKSSATVERVDYDCNLALLRPSDPGFLEGMKPLTLEKSLRVGNEAAVLQLEPNGEIAQTIGQITSISVGAYPLENLGLLQYKFRVPLQQRDSSFTLPAVSDGRLVGLLMRFDARSQSADLISTPVIRHFLDSPAQSRFPRMGLSFSALRDPQFRRFIGLTEPGGIYVNEVSPHGSAAEAGIKRGDVLLALDGHAIDQDGNYDDPNFGRVLFSHLTNTVAKLGSEVTFTIFRNGKLIEIPAVMRAPDRSHVVSDVQLADQPPDYIVLGGLVFLELSRPYLQEWGNDWVNAAPKRLVYYDAFQNELPEGRGKIVILAQVLPTPETLGYEDLQNLVVTEVNGKRVQSLSELAEALKKPLKGFQKIEFEEDPKTIFLDAASIEANQKALIERYSLPALQRL
ncbi:MAG: PDZ domain-containing protein [bacterium]